MGKLRRCQVFRRACNHGGCRATFLAEGRAMVQGDHRWLEVNTSIQENIAAVCRCWLGEEIPPENSTLEVTLKASFIEIKSHESLWSHEEFAASTHFRYFFAQNFINYERVKVCWTSSNDDFRRKIFQLPVERAKAICFCQYFQIKEKQLKNFARWSYFFL